MRNVNEIIYDQSTKAKQGFILTMRNVNDEFNRVIGMMQGVLS